MMFNLNMITAFIKSSTRRCQAGMKCSLYKEQHEDASVAAALLFCGTHYENLEHDFMQLTQDSYATCAKEVNHYAHQTLCKQGRRP